MAWGMSDGILKPLRMGTVFVYANLKLPGGWEMEF
jgi:hypothetical protein